MMFRYDRRLEHLKPNLSTCQSGFGKVIIISRPRPSRFDKFSIYAIVLLIIDDLWLFYQSIMLVHRYGLMRNPKKSLNSLTPGRIVRIYHPIQNPIFVRENTWRMNSVALFLA